MSSRKTKRRTLSLPRRFAGWELVQFGDEDELPLFAGEWRIVGEGPPVYGSGWRIVEIDGERWVGKPYGPELPADDRQHADWYRVQRDLEEIARREPRIKTASKGGDARAVVIADENANRDSRIENAYREAVAANPHQSWTQITDKIGPRFAITGRQVRNILNAREVQH
jgi:hypothetical protein